MYNSAAHLVAQYLMNRQVYIIVALAANGMLIALAQIADATYIVAGHQGIPARRQLTCTISTSAYICGKDTYGDCVKPTITYMLPNQWTNQDVTVNYSGTTSGSLTFSDNGTQSVTVTSSTGHRIKEDITVDKIDKIAPVMPDYDYSK